VGASVEELSNALGALHGTRIGNVHVHQLEHLESARDVIVREAMNLHYGIRRNAASHTDHYERARRRVEVQYDASFEDVEEVRVVLPLTRGTYPATIAGARAALQLPYEG
jgi:hypothetical protein